MADRNGKSKSLAAIREASRDEQSAVEFLEQTRWGDAPACPRCGSVNVYPMQDRKGGGREKNYRWRCRDCKRMYTVRTNTIMEESRLPLSIWCHVIWRTCASKKGISALQIQRECEISYTTALYLMKRVREMMGIDHPTPSKLSGIVEADETYVGGKPRYRIRPDPKSGKRATGRGTRKTPVFAVVQRGGDVRLSKLERITAPELIPAIWQAIDAKNTTVMTDELGAYQGVGRRVSGGHKTVKHSAGQYVDGVNGEVHSNTAESVFSLIKRGLIGTFHSVSRAHLPRYLNEFEFRWNTRYLDDGERVLAALHQAEGKRLTYADSLVPKGN